MCSTHEVSDTIVECVKLEMLEVVSVAFLTHMCRTKIMLNYVVCIVLTLNSNNCIRNVCQQLKIIKCDLIYSTYSHRCCLHLISTCTCTLNTQLSIVYASLSLKWRYCTRVCSESINLRNIWLLKVAHYWVHNKNFLSLWNQFQTCTFNLDKVLIASPYLQFNFFFYQCYNISACVTTPTCPIPFIICLSLTHRAQMIHHFHIVAY